MFLFTLFHPDIRIEHHAARTPLPAQNPFCHIRMKTGMLPCNRRVHAPVLHGIVMDVIHMAVEIRIVPDSVLPIPPLPDGSFILSHPGRRIFDANVGVAPRKIGFDQADTFRVIVVANRQRHEKVQVLRQNDNGLQHERMALIDAPESAPQQGNIFRSIQKFLSLMRYESEKIGSSADFSSAIAHGL